MFCCPHDQSLPARARSHGSYWQACNLGCWLWKYSTQSHVLSCIFPQIFIYLFADFLLFCPAGLWVHYNNRFRKHFSSWFSVFIAPLVYNCSRRTTNTINGYTIQRPRYWCQGTDDCNNPAKIYLTSFGCFHC